MAFSTNLQYLRRLQVGLTQEKLAEKLGVSRQSVLTGKPGKATRKSRSSFSSASFFTASWTHCFEKT